jgi:hypothetical protein
MTNVTQTIKILMCNNKKYWIINYLIIKKAQLRAIFCSLNINFVFQSF